MEYPEIERQHRELRTAMERLRGLLSEGGGSQPADLAAEARTLENDLRKHFEYEESGGYLGIVLEKRPGWSRRVDHLRKQHREILRAFGRLRELPAREVAGAIGRALDLVHEHDVAECDLVQRAVIEDIGAGD